MRIGVMLDIDQPIDGVLADAVAARDAGMSSLWCWQIFGFDALTLLALVGREVPEVELGTAVVPIQPRHPIVLASQALTTQAAVGGRLTLGIGLSHQVVIEGVYGYPFDRPVTRMRETLSVLLPLLAREQVNFQGEVIRANTIGPLSIQGTEAPAVVIAALGPSMLRLAGHMTAGTVTWMTGPRTVESHIAPSIQLAAKEAGRPAPRIVVGLPTVVTDDAPSRRERVAEAFAIYGHLPSYRAMLDREGVQGPADVSVVGNESEVRAALERIDAAGATDFVAYVAAKGAERERTMSLLSELAR
jgi:5,10-methylenetetrahydromethanopterin reductase